MARRRQERDTLVRPRSRRPIVAECRRHDRVSLLTLPKYNVACRGHLRGSVTRPNSWTAAPAGHPNDLSEGPSGGVGAPTFGGPEGQKKATFRGPGTPKSGVGDPESGVWEGVRGAGNGRLGPGNHTFPRSGRSRVWPVWGRPGTGWGRPRDRPGRPPQGVPGPQFGGSGTPDFRGPGEGPGDPEIGPKKGRLTLVPGGTPKNIVPRKASNPETKLFEKRVFQGGGKK